MFRNTNLQLKVFRVDGPRYAVRLCNNEDYSYFVEEGVLDGFAQNTNISVILGPSTVTCISRNKINNSLIELNKKTCIGNEIDFNSICDFTIFKASGHYDILYETKTKLCALNDEDSNCTLIKLAGNVEYSHYPNPGGE